MANGNAVLQKKKKNYLLLSLSGVFYPDFCSPNCFRMEFITLSAQLIFENT